MFFADEMNDKHFHEEKSSIEKKWFSHFDDNYWSNKEAFSRKNFKWCLPIFSLFENISFLSMFYWLLKNHRRYVLTKHFALCFKIRVFFRWRKSFQLCEYWSTGDSKSIGSSVFRTEMFVVLENDFVMITDFSVIQLWTKERNKYHENWKNSS